LWARRHFITAFSTAKLTAQYSQAKLGQVWQVMNPLLNAAVYFFIFGVLLGTKKGVPDYIPFLVTGVFIWTFTQSSIMAGPRAVSGNLGLVRALHFPRAALPISFCLQQLQQL
ncbi:ABC transporter permease, partial [Enterobacter quasiroggenkampii]|uniref:ABC transporter permease n=1 Tax=Enterobacter quasiroggenkampii TaxID=2497436 RepID=UPI0021CEE539